MKANAKFYSLILLILSTLLASCTSDQKINQAMPTTGLSQLTALPIQTPRPIPALQATRNDPITQDELHILLEYGMWFCFPFQSEEIGIHVVRENFEIEPPLIAIHTRSGSTTTKVTIESGATASLDGPLAPEECPTSQQVALRRFRANQTPLTRSLVDEALGSTDWYCTGDNDIIIIDSHPLVLIDYPFIAMDNKYNQRKNGIGWLMPADAGETAYLFAPLLETECR